MTSGENERQNQAGIATQGEQGGQQQDNAEEIVTKEKDAPVLGSLPHLIKHIETALPGRTYIQIRSRLARMRVLLKRNKRVEYCTSRFQAVLAAVSGTNVEATTLTSHHVTAVVDSMEREALLHNIMVILREPEETYDSTRAHSLISCFKPHDLQMVQPVCPLYTSYFSSLFIR